MKSIGVSQGVAGLSTVFAVALLVVPVPAGVPADVMTAAALAVLAIGFWASAVLPQHVTALGFFLFAVLFAVAPPVVVFSGFYSTALWLVFGGLILSVAIKRSGLGARIARTLARRLVGASYPGIIAGVVAIAAVLAFFVPSAMGRILMFAPIVMALAERLGFAPGSRGHTGMVLAACLATSFAGFTILTGNVPNMVLIGASETLYGFVPAYGAYLLLHFPVSGALKLVMLVGCVCVLFPDQPRPVEDDEEEPPADDGSARRLMVILVAALALWSTDFIHHISPAWIALGAAILCLLPRIGMVPPSAFNGEVNYSSLFFVAGILGMGAMIADSGLGDYLAGGLVEVAGLVPGENGRNFAVMALISILLCVVTTVPGVPAVMTPLAGGMVAASGLPLETVLMTQVIGFSTLIFPYQTPPVTVGMQVAGIRNRDALRLMLLMTALTLFVLLPLNFAWWSLLGYLP